MTKHITQAPDGTIYISDGINGMRKWDGIDSSFEDAGVPAPSTTVSLTASGDGEITGSLYAYQRWLDGDGRLSNVSPVSSELIVSISSGLITAASNAAPISITSTAHGLTTADRVKISGVIGNIGANGTWVVIVVDADTFTLTSSVGTAAYQSGGEWDQGASQISYTSVDAPSDTRIVTRQICRSKDGNSNVVYIDVETTDLVSTSFNSTNKDSDLTQGLGFSLTDTAGRDLSVVRFGVPPSYKFAFAHSNDRMVGTGDPHYSEGAVLVTNASATVTGIGTAWTDEMVDRYLYVTGSTVSYQISSVNTSAQTMVISAIYAGTTSQFSSYAIIPDTGNRKTVMWSEAGFPEAWNPLSLKRLPEDVSSGEVTGVFTYDRWVYITTENRLYRFSYQGDPGKIDSFIGYGPQRGMVNNRCWCNVDGTTYIMDIEGIYTFSGNDMRPVSASIRSMFDKFSDFKWRINWKWSKYFHAVHDPNSNVVRFFVSLTGRYPRHALCYNYRLKRWWIEEYPVGITSSTLGKLSDGNQVFLGTESKRVIAIGLGNVDGPSKSGGTLRGTVTSSGVDWIVDSAAAFDTTELVNTSVRIVDGTGVGYWRKIVSVTATKLYVDQPFLTRPDTTSVYQVGGVSWNYRTGWFRWAETDYNNPRDVEVVFHPLTNTALGGLKVYHDRSETAIDWKVTRSLTEGVGIRSEKDSSRLVIDQNKTNGYAKQEMGDSRETNTDGNRFISIELSGVTNAERQKVHEVSIGGAQ